MKTPPLILLQLAEKAFRSAQATLVFADAIEENGDLRAARAIRRRSTLDRIYVVVDKICTRKKLEPVFVHVHSRTARAARGSRTLLQLTTDAWFLAFFHEPISSTREAGSRRGGPHRYRFRRLEWVPLDARGRAWSGFMGLAQRVGAIEAALHIDPVNGDDANPGTREAPLRTWAENIRRVGGEVRGNVTSNILLPGDVHHEAMGAVGDPEAAAWTEHDDGVLPAVELCDSVQAQPATTRR